MLLSTTPWIRETTIQANFARAAARKGQLAPCWMWPGEVRLTASATWTKGWSQASGRTILMQCEEEKSRRNTFALFPSLFLFVNKNVGRLKLAGETLCSSKCFSIFKIFCRPYVGKLFQANFCRNFNISQSSPGIRIVGRINLYSFLYSFT